jgi:hypothetical protein
MGHIECAPTSVVELQVLSALGGALEEPPPDVEVCFFAGKDFDWEREQGLKTQAEESGIKQSWAEFHDLRGDWIAHSAKNFGIGQRAYTQK